MAELTQGRGSSVRQWWVSADRKRGGRGREEHKEAAAQGANLVDLIVGDVLGEALIGEHLHTSVTARRLGRSKEPARALGRARPGVHVLYHVQTHRLRVERAPSDDSAARRPVTRTCDQAHLGDCRRQGRLAVVDVPDGPDVQVRLGAAVDVVGAVVAIRAACLVAGPEADRCRELRTGL